SAAKPTRQCNSSLSSNYRKRKPEFDVEEEGQGQADEEKSEITMKADREASTNTCCRETSKVSEVQKPDYIHVRARRGQATDSHSLAERARREKISKKMKCLQDLVPGCNTVTGKAGMLDEIINYVQSLQKQVEFLSMKLAAVNTRFDFSTDSFFLKESPASVCCLPSSATQFEPTNANCFPYNLLLQGPSNSVSDIAVDQ
ncbi:hypothetical protein M569_05311, partial [Genlisea aurea]